MGPFKPHNLLMSPLGDMGGGGGGTTVNVDLNKVSKTVSDTFSPNEAKFILECTMRLYINSMFEDPLTGQEKPIREIMRRAYTRAKQLAQYIKIENPKIFKADSYLPNYLKD